MRRPADVDDATLVSQARARDKGAFAELVARHVPTAERLVTRVLGDPDLARDVSHEAIVTALVSLERLRTPEQFGSWLCGIALNIARRWAVELRFRSAAFDFELVDPGPGPGELAEAALVASRVRQAIAALADGQRRAVWLFYLQDLSHREVAAELGISVGAVKARLHQGRAALAQRLADEIEEEFDMSATQVPASWVDVEVTAIRGSGGPHEFRRYVVILRAAAGKRMLPIWIGPAEAGALSMTIEGVETRRPTTYQFAAGLLDVAGASVSEVRLASLAESVYYAIVVLDGPLGKRELDTRPSDALNLALLVGAPIRAKSDLLDDGTEQAGNASDYPISAAAIVAESQERARLSVRDLAELAREADGEEPPP